MFLIQGSETTSRTPDLPRVGNATDTWPGLAPNALGQVAQRSRTASVGNTMAAMRSMNYYERCREFFRISSIAYCRLLGIIAKPAAQARDETGSPRREQGKPRPKPLLALRASTSHRFGFAKCVADPSTS